jgi:hypothetical protein
VTLGGIATDGSTTRDLGINGFANFTSSGRVGIGLTDPQYTLDVAGDIRANNFIFASSLIFSSISSLTVSTGSVTTRSLNVTSLSTGTLSVPTLNAINLSTGTVSVPTLNTINLSTGIITVPTVNVTTVNSQTVSTSAVRSFQVVTSSISGFSPLSLNDDVVGKNAYFSTATYGPGTYNAVIVYGANYGATPATSSIIVSFDSGATFRSVASLNGSKDVNFVGKLNNVWFATAYEQGTAANRIMRSTDLLNWSSVTQPTYTDTWVGDEMIYANGQWITMQHQGCGCGGILHSSNGWNFTSIDSCSIFPISQCGGGYTYRLKYGLGYFVMTGWTNDGGFGNTSSNLAIIYSSDLSNWSQATIQSNYFKGGGGLAFDGTKFIATGNVPGATATNVFRWSSNGTDFFATGFTGETSFLGGGTGTSVDSRFVDIAFANNMWVAIGQSSNGDSNFRYSYDGFAWSIGTGPTQTGAFQYRHINYARGRWIVNTPFNTNPSPYLYSYDGINWSNGTSYSNGTFYWRGAVENDYTPGGVFANYISTTLITATSQDVTGFLNASTIYARRAFIGANVSSTTYSLALDADSAAKPATNTWTIASDERIKCNIVAADNEICYSTLKTLPLRHFEWSSNYYTEEQVRDRHALGFIAQEVKPYYPKAVDIIPEYYGLSNFHTLNVDQIYKAHIGATKQLMWMVERQQAVIEEQQSTIAGILARLA